MIARLRINDERTDCELVTEVILAKRNKLAELAISWNTKPSLTTPLTLIQTCKNPFYTNLALALAFSATKEVEVMERPFSLAAIPPTLNKLEEEIYSQLEKLYWPNLSLSLSEHNQLIEETMLSRLKLARAIIVGLSKNKKYKTISATLLSKIQPETIKILRAQNG